MFELATSYAIYMAIFLSLMAIVKYISYRSTIGDVHNAFQEFAERHNGHLEKGSFLVPPSVTFKGSHILDSTDKIENNVTLRSYYLYRGRRGNYTELAFKLPSRNYMTSFSVKLDNPRLDEDSSWSASVTEPVATVENTYDKLTTCLTQIGDRFSAEHLKCRFDGEKLSIRVLEFIDKADDIDEFYNLSESAFKESLRISNKS